LGAAFRWSGDERPRPFGIIQYFFRTAVVHLPRQKEPAMEYLVTMTTHIPEGTPDAAVDAVRPRGRAVARARGAGASAPAVAAAAGARPVAHVRAVRRRRRRRARAGA